MFLTNIAPSRSHLAQGPSEDGDYKRRKKETDIVVARLETRGVRYRASLNPSRSAKNSTKVCGSALTCRRYVRRLLFVFETPRDLFRGREGTLLRGAATRTGYL